MSSESQIVSAQSAPGDILLVTATQIETQTVLDLFKEKLGVGFTRRHLDRATYYDLGNVNGTTVFLIQSELGSGGPSGSSLLTVSEAISALAPSAVIMVGIAFGLDRRKQHIGDILVSKQLL